MSIRTEFRVIDDLLIVTASGEFDAETDETFDKLVAERCREAHIEKVLIDFRNVDGKPSMLDSFVSGSSLRERGFMPDTKLVIVDREEFRETNQFYELVASNRGYVVRHFYNLNEALEWYGVSHLSMPRKDH